jgi:hypothetical protein
MVKQEVSSDMMVPKWRVLTPLLEVRVLGWDEKERLEGEVIRTFHAWDRKSMPRGVRNFLRP